MDSQTVEALFAPGFIQHNPGMASGLPALKDALDRAKAAYPRAMYSVKRMMADGDLVMAHVHAIFEPGDAGVALVNIFRVENGLIAEHWDVGSRWSRDRRTRTDGLGRRHPLALRRPASKASSAGQSACPQSVSPYSTFGGT